MTTLLCDLDDDDDDDDDADYQHQHVTARHRPTRHHHNNVTTPTRTEIESEDTLFKAMVNKVTKSPARAEGSSRKTAGKCTAACSGRKVDRCTTAGAADATAAPSSLYSSDVLQKTCRTGPQHDRVSSACTKGGGAADCRGQCPRTGKHGAANDYNLQQCTGTTRSHRAANDGQFAGSARKYGANDGQCTSGGGGGCGGCGKYAANDNPQCTVGARNRRATTDDPCTGNYGANCPGRCAGTAAAGSHRVNDGQFTGAGNYRGDNDGRSTGTGNYAVTNNGGGCIVCGCISVAAATCPAGANAGDTLTSTVYRWARVAVDWTWDKTSYLLVAAVSFFLGMYTYDWCLCTCEEVP